MSTMMFIRDNSARKTIATTITHARALVSPLIHFLNHRRPCESPILPSSTPRYRFRWHFRRHTCTVSDGVKSRDPFRTYDNYSRPCVHTPDNARVYISLRRLSRRPFFRDRYGNQLVINIFILLFSFLFPFSQRYCYTNPVVPFDERIFRFRATNCERGPGVLRNVSRGPAAFQ